VATSEDRDRNKTWTFLTNHARVLICIAQAPQARVRDIAKWIGITERATQIIIGDLEEADYLTRTRIGRRNAYTVNPDRPFRHPTEAAHDVRALIKLFDGEDAASPLGDADDSQRGAADPAPTAPSLRVRISQVGGYAVVTAAGSIDLTTRALLEDHLDRAIQQTRLAVIVDLSEVEFCDSIGLNTFTRARRKATARGMVMVVVGLHNRVEYTFAVTRLDQAFYPQPDLQAALEWLENGSAKP
jgi:anti-anti-sigma factor